MHEACGTRLDQLELWCAKLAELELCGQSHTAHESTKTNVVYGSLRGVPAAVVGKNFQSMFTCLRLPCMDAFSGMRISDAGLRTGWAVGCNACDGPRRVSVRRQICGRDERCAVTACSFR